MKWIKDMPKLTHLHLKQTPGITESGLLQLKDAKQLRSLVLELNASKETVEQLAKEMQWCEIRD